MTQGNPIRIILAFAVTLFIGNLFQQFYNMVDTMVVARHLGDSAIAAISATASLYSLLINFANVLNNGDSIIVTQQLGAWDRRTMKQAIAGMMLLNLLVSIMGYWLVPVCSGGIELCMLFLSASLIIPRVGFWGTCVTEPITWVIMVVILLFFYQKKLGFLK